jgi:hypothetical protein
LYVPVVGSWFTTFARIHSDPGVTWHAAKSLGLPTTAVDDAKSPDV